MNENIENKCFDADCDKYNCTTPKHFNFICLDPNCENVHCELNEHYDKRLLNINSNSNAVVERDDECHDDSCSCHDHTHEDVEVKICHDDCCDDDDDDECCDDSCSCHDNDSDEVDVKICNCDDCCDDDNDEEDVIAEGKPLLANKSIQIIATSLVFLVLGHLFEYLGIVTGIEYVFFLIGTIVAGYEFMWGGIKALIYKHRVSTSFLIFLAALCSFLIGHPEEAAVVTFLYFISEFLEDYAEQRAQHSIKSLVEIAPETAIVKVSDGEEERRVEEVAIGEIILIKPGEKVPLDGIVIKGASSINQASITGESIPVNKKINDEVFAGTVNQEGYLEVEVTKESNDTVISRIVDLVKQSQLNRSNTERFVDVFAKYYTPAVIIGAILVAIIPPLLLAGSWIDWIYRALTIMVVSCPCAFVISTPVAMVSSITSATRKGVLIKGSSYIEEMKNIKAVVFDKTGTLTEGKLEVTDVLVLDDNYSKEEILGISASLEAKSTHPISDAIINHIKINSIPLKEVDNFKNIAGKGITGYINNKEYYAGNESLIDGSSFDISSDKINEYAGDGKTVVFVGDENNVIGLISVRDKIRDESIQVISSLKQKGVTTVMLTGDNKVSAENVASKLGVDYVYSDVLPQDKLNVVDIIRNKFGDVAMVGDGINDAPALSRADVGIAMGAVGSDVAIETADVALMQDDLTKLPYLFDLSYRTMSVVKQNVITAAGVKSIFAILAVFGLITLMMAVGFGDMGLTLLVILNSLRIGMVKSEIN